MQSIRYIRITFSLSFYSFVWAGGGGDCGDISKSGGGRDNTGIRNGPADHQSYLIHHLFPKSRGPLP